MIVPGSRRLVLPRTTEPAMNDQSKYAAREQTNDPVGAEIPNFLRFAPVEDAEGVAKLALLNERARAGDWRQALESTYQDAGFVRYVTQLDRAAFLDLLPIDASTEVLEIGPGLGQFTALMAKRARSVHALEVVPGQAEFALTRCRQQGLTNVQIAVGGDDCRLPYRDQAFDLIVLNLVFEWCGSRLEDEPHEVAQKRLLSEMVRVLKPGGALYLTTKNRYSMRLLRGGGDEHQFGLRFGSALPRALSARLLRRRGHRRAMGMLYSHDRLAAMLRDAGLTNLRSYWAAPEMRYPTHYIATDAASVRAARAQPGLVQASGRLTNWLTSLVPARWVRHVIPGLAFLAFKPGAADATAARSAPTR
jgi:SAM-dependent methyltransferase